MKIAATYEQGMVGQHFGRTEEFKVYDVEDGEVTESVIIKTNGVGHRDLIEFLSAAKVEKLICGGIGMGARMAVENSGIELFPGVTGNADDAVKDYLDGKLVYDPESECHHHDHEDGQHRCGNEHGCH